MEACFHSFYICICICQSCLHDDPLHLIQTNFHTSAALSRALQFVAWQAHSENSDIFTCQLFDGLDRYLMFSGSFARRMAQYSVREARESRPKQALGNMSKVFMDRAFSVACKAYMAEYGPGDARRREYHLPPNLADRTNPATDYQKASCTGVVSTLVGNKMHVWQMGDALWALLQFDRKKPTPAWTCTKLSEPMYNPLIAATSDCMLADKPLARKIQELRKHRRVLVCPCEKGTGRRTKVEGEHVYVPCIPTPKTLCCASQGISGFLNEARTEIIDVQDGDLFIMGELFPMSGCAMFSFVCAVCIHWPITRLIRRLDLSGSVLSHSCRVFELSICASFYACVWLCVYIWVYIYIYIHIYIYIYLAPLSPYPCWYLWSGLPRGVLIDLGRAAFFIAFLEVSDFWKLRVPIWETYKCPPE